MTGKIVLLTIGVFVAIGITAGQSGQGPQGSRARVLVLPRPGIPLSFEQTEERLLKLPNGTFAKSVVTGKTYRDSAGRLRVESKMTEEPGHGSTSYGLVTDPTAGSQVIFLPTLKVAFRRSFQVSSESRLLTFTDPMEGIESLHKWKFTTETAGKRTMEGVEFDGTRVTKTAEDDPGLTGAIERWYSDELKLVGAATVSGPDISCRSD
jgi:hypothetical protein